jgi:drug/metabolite transporter (DMT)-like permease
LNGGLGPFTVAALRFLIAAAVLSVIVPAVGARWPRGRAEWTLVLVVGVLLFGGDYGLIYWAEQYIDSGLTAILFGTFPLATMIAAHVYVPGEQLTPRKITGGALAFIGVVTLFGDRLNVNASALWPMAAVIAAVVCAAISNVATKRHGGAAFRRAQRDDDDGGGGCAGRMVVLSGDTCGAAGCPRVDCRHVFLARGAPRLPYLLSLLKTGVDDRRFSPCCTDHRHRLGTLFRASPVRMEPGGLGADS